MKKGFTLLELIIVIIIIGLLSAIGVTQYAKAIVNAKNAQAKTVLGEMRHAARAYESTYGTWPTASGPNVTIDVNFDGVAGDEVTFAAFASNDFNYSIDSGFGKATAKAGSTASSWQIDFNDGTISAF